MPPTVVTTASRRRQTPTQVVASPLGRYTDTDGRAREIVSVSGVGNSTLVLDRLANTHTDARLVVHLSADEPSENARVVCALYLSDARGRHCRAVTSDDFQSEPCCDPARAPISRAAKAAAAELVDGLGFSYSVGPVAGQRGIPQLRWRRCGRGQLQPVSVRAVVGALESYEPARALTIAALADPAGETSQSVLRAELTRLDESRVVLNRGLRDAVARAIERKELTMSEIAMRCGRVKRDLHGKKSGETSWLARRIGLMPDGGRCAATPWVHSQVLALIARHGLGVAPREVEVE